MNRSHSPYVDSGDEWIDETAQRTYFWGNESVVNAERAAQSVTDAGRTGVTLRFSMFHAIDSQHMRTFISMAEKGICGIPGDPEGYISFIAVDDAARAVLAAFDVPAGVYNVSESDPVRRSEHAAALTACTNRERLRAIPTTAQHLGGKGIDSLSRSQRISSKALTEATSWEPKIHPINRWRLVH